MGPVRQHRLISMQDTTLDTGNFPPDTTLANLIDRHGAATVLRALATVLGRRLRTRRNAAALPDQLRRDIGLPERGEPPPRLRGPWM
ncbi:hypothetical protein [Sinisalibacter lacisalsi]|uniref:DUF1127 domain-containing protein n=1 Tax=Sinisalibacter lacisalsi TaxID=1526570 RepID=A0ABQ1QGY0_9RHOB|nr:hypothetical protein [Sinisalibacter lacisalsi]GGD24756.1 hypothetical protein GCM10011358_06480 [Sinisalibacter lacisalsi]